MKYVITGSLGHISKPLAQKLIQAGHQVTIISSKSDKKNEIESLGARAAIGSVEDTAFLTKTFAGADAIYTMVPPNFSASDWKGYIELIGKNYADAIGRAGVKYVVNLSSIGAHMPVGCGPVSGIYRVEKALNDLPDVQVLHLRPASFYYNFLNNIGMIKHMGIIGGNYGTGTKLVMVDPNDTAEVAAEELIKLSFKGKSHKYIVSDIKTTDEVAALLGSAIGKPDLKWVDFTDEQSLAGMVQAGVPQEQARNFVEMGSAIRNGEMFSDYSKSHSASNGTSKLEDFAKVFAAAYAQS